MFATATIQPYAATTIATCYYYHHIILYVFLAQTCILGAKLPSESTRSKHEPQQLARFADLQCCFRLSDSRRSVCPDWSSGRRVHCAEVVRRRSQTSHCIRFVLRLFRPLTFHQPRLCTNRHNWATTKYNCQTPRKLIMTIHFKTSY